MALKMIPVVLLTSRLSCAQGPLRRGAAAQTTEERLKQLAAYDPPRARRATKDEAGSDPSSLPVLV